MSCSCTSILRRTSNFFRSVFILLVIVFSNLETLQPCLNSKTIIYTNNYRLLFKFMHFFYLHWSIYDFLLNVKVIFSINISPPQNISFVNVVEINRMRKFLINSSVWIKCNHGLTRLLFVFKFNVRIICTYQGVLRMPIMTCKQICTIYFSFQGGGLLFLNGDCNYVIVFYHLSKSVGHI